MVEQAGQGTAVAEPEIVTQGVAPKAEASAESIDWEARYKEEKATREKAEHKVKSIEGNLRRQGETDARFDEMNATLKAQAQAQVAMLDALRTGDTEGLQGKIDEGVQQVREFQTNAAFNQYYSSMFESLVGTTTDADGNPLFDVAKARAALGPDAEGKTDEMVVLLADPAYEEVREIWGQALPQGDQTPAHARKPEKLADALRVANKNSRRHWSLRQKAEVEAARQEGSQKSRVALLDLDGGRAAPGSDGLRDMSPKDRLNEADQRLRKS